MKYAVIDIGSNSVRLMISIDGQTQCKYVKTTRLAEKMGDTCVLQDEPMERTANAVSFFVYLDGNRTHLIQESGGLLPNSGSTESAPF